MSLENKTVVVDSQGFSEIKTDLSKKGTSEENFNQEKGLKSDGISQLPGNIVKTVNDNFSTSFFILFLIGYVIIEAFGKSGIDFKEYLELVLALSLFYSFLRFIKPKVIGSSFEKIINLINKKIYAIIVAGVVLIDTIYNHSSLVDKIMNLVKNYL